MIDPTEQLLRGAVLAAPEDDIPRLQYADWADAQGDPRGDFIRVQCALAGTRASGTRMALRARERKLLKAHRARWTAGASKVGVKVAFDRGFIGGIQVYSKGLGALPGLLSEEPITRLSLMMPKEKSALATALGLPGIKRLRSLKIFGAYGGIGSEGLKILMNAELKGLRALLLGDCGLTDKTVASLAASQGLRGLRTLSLSGNSALGDASVEALVSDGCGFSLEAMYLSRTKVTGEVISRLSTAPRAMGLRFLALCATGFDDASAEVLAQTPGFSGLWLLDLMHTRVTEKGALLLAGSENLGGMMRLDLRGTDGGRSKVAREALRARFGNRVRLPVENRAEGETDEDYEEEDQGEGEDEG